MKPIHIKESSVSYARRWIALWTCVIFLQTTLFASVPAQAAQPVPTPSDVLPLHFDSLQIPQDIGKVDDFFTGSSDFKVIIVQDAHAIPDAQRSIRKAILYFHQKYGVNLIALEGASAKLDARMLKSFPDKERLNRVLGEYFDQGELAGGTAAAISGIKAEDNSAAGSRLIFQGIEDWPVYEEALGLYLAAMGKEKNVLEAVKSQKSKVESQKKENYSPELLKIDQAISAFRGNSSDFMKTLEVLAAVKVPEKGSELELLLQEAKSEGADQTGAEVEVRRIAEKIKKLEVGSSPPKDGSALNVAEKLEDKKEFNQKYQAFQTGQLSAKAFALFLREFLAASPALYSRLKTQDPQLSASLTRLSGSEKRMRNIEGTKLFSDFEIYAQSVKESLFASDAVRELDREDRKLWLMTKLAKLELSYEDWEELNKGKGKREKGKGEKEKIEQNQELIESLSPLSFPLFPLFESHVAFYENALKRDDIFFTNLQRLLKVNDSRSTIHAPRRTALLVAGGFHAHGLCSLLKENGISYALVMPEIKNLPEQSHYRQHMQGNVSWKNYFEVKNGKVNLYNAFIRGTRDRLIGASRESWVVSHEKDQSNSPRPTPQDPRLLKTWRDQIIRDLADEGRIEKAGEYTRFIDELTGGGRDKAIQKRLAQVDQFLEDLKKLDAQGQFTAPNIVKLFPLATALSIVGGSQQPDAWMNLMAMSENRTLREGQPLSTAKSEVRHIEGETASRLDEQAQTVIKKALTELGLSDGVFARDPANVEKFIFDKTLDISAFLGQELSKKQKIEIAHLQNKYRIEKVMAEFAVDLKKLKLEAERGKGEFPSPEQQESKLGQLLSENDVRLDLEREVFEIPKQYDDTAQKAQDKLPEKLKEDLKKAMDAGLVVINQNPPYSNWGPEPGISESLFGHYAPNLSQVIFQGDFYIDDNEAAQIDVISLDHSASPFTKYQLMPGQRRLRFHVYVREGQVYLEIVDLVGSEDSRSSGSFYQSFYGVVKFFANGLQREVLLVGETAVLKGKKKSLGLTRINDEQSLIKKLWIETIQTIAPEKIKDLTARGITERENFRYYEASFKPETSTNVQGILPSNAGQDGLSSIFDDASQRNLLVAAARRVAYFSGLNLGEVLSKVLVASSLSGYDNQTLKLLVNSANKPELTTLAPTTNHNRWALLKELFAKSADQTRLEAFIVLAVSRTEGINERAIRDLVENSLNYGLQYALLIRKLSSDPKNLALIEQLVELGKRLPFIERGETHNLLFLKRLQNRLESTLPGNGAALSFGTVDQARLATEVASLAARHGLEESPFPAYLRAALKAGPEILNAFLASIPSDLIDALLSLKTQREQDGKQYDIPELILRRESQSLQSNEPLKSSLRASFQLPNLPVNAQVVIVNLMSQDNNFLSEIIRNDTIQPYVRLIALGHLAANPAATTLGNLADMAVLADELRGKMTDTSFNEAAADSGIAPSIMIQGQAIAANILRAQALGEMIIPPRVLRRVLAQAVLTGGILYAKSHPTSESVDSANADFKFGRGFADAMTLREMWTVAVHEGQHLFSEAIIRSFAKAQRGGNYDTVFAALDELLSNLAELAYLQQSQGKLSKQAFDWVMKLNSNFEDHEAGGNRYSPLEGHILSAKVLAEFGKLQNVEAVDFTALLVSVIKEVQQYGESHFNVGLDAENPEEKRVTLFTELLETALLSAVVSAAQPEAARSEVRAIERVTPETRTSDEEVAAPEAGGVLPLLGSSNWLKKHNKRMEDLNSVGLADVFYLDKSGQVQVSTGSIRDWISQEYMLMRVSKEKQDADIYTQGYIPVPFEVDSQGRKVPAIYNIVEGQAVRMDPREIETKLGLTAVVAPDETTLTVKGFVRNTDAKVARVFSLIGNFSIYFSKDSGVLLRTLGDLEGVDPFITESMAGDKETEEVSEYAQLLIQKLLREGKIAARPSLALEFKGVGSQFSGYQHARNEASQKYAAVENKFVLIVGDGGFKEGFGFAGWEESLGKDRQRTITQNGGELNDRILIAHKIVERSESTSASNIDGYISARFILGSNTTLRMDQVTRRTLLPLLKDKYTDTADEEVLVKRYLYGIAFRLGRDARAVLDSGFVMDSGGNSLDNYSAFGQIADSGTLNTKGNRNLYPLSLRNNLLVRIANTLKAESLIFGIQKTFDDAFSLNFLVRRDAHAEASTPITAVKRSEVRSTDPRSVVQFSPESDPLNVAKINEAYMELNKLYPRRSEMRQLPVDGAATTTQGAVTAIVGILNRYYSRVGADDAKLLKGNERVQLIKAARVMRSFVEAGTDVEGETLELLAALQGFISYRGRADTKQIAKTLLTNSLERMNTALQINGLAIEFHEREVDPFLISQVPQSEQSNRSEMRVAAGRMSKAGLIETMDQYQLIDKDEKDFLKSRKGQKALTAVRTQARSEGIWNTDHEIELIERILALLSQREIEAGDNALFDAVTSQTGKSTPDVTLEPGQRLLRNGEKHAYFYLLLSGAVEIKGIGISKAPTFLGESVLLGQAAGADVIAIEGEAQLIRFTNEELQPDLREAILADFSRKKESMRRRLIRRSMLQRLKDDRRSKQAQVAGQLSVLRGKLPAGDLAPERLNDFIDALIRTGYFQSLEKIQKQGLASDAYQSLQALLQKFIAENKGFAVYGKDEIISSAESEARGNGLFHFVMDGVAEARRKDGSVMEFSSGAAFSAGAISRGRTYEAEVTAKKTVTALTLNAKQYAELIELFIRLGMASEPVPLSDVDEDLLKKLTVSYQGADSSLRRIRSVDEILRDPDVPLAVKHQILAGEHALFNQIRTHDFVRFDQGVWSGISVSLHRDFQAGLNRILLRKFSAAKPFSGLSHAEKIHVAASIEAVENPSEEFRAEGEPLKLKVVTLPADSLRRGDLYLISSPAGFGGQEAGSEKWKGTVLVRLVFSKPEGGEEIEKNLTVKITNGIVDPRALLARVKKHREFKELLQQGYRPKLKEATFSMPAAWQVHRLNQDKYRERIDSAQETSIDFFLEKLAKAGYDVDPEKNKDNYAEAAGLIRAEFKRLKDAHGPDYTRLTQNFRRDLFDLIRLWLKFSQSGRTISHEEAKLPLLDLRILLHEYVDAYQPPAKRKVLRSIIDDKKLQPELLVKYAGLFPEFAGRISKEVDLIKIWGAIKILRGDPISKNSPWRGPKWMHTLNADKYLSAKRVKGVLAAERTDSILEGVHGLPEKAVLIPDIHSGEPELIHWFRANGLMDENGEFIFRPGLNVTMQGDTMDRIPGENILDILGYIRRYVDKIEEWNRNLPKSQKMKLTILLGNQELDILKTPLDKITEREGKFARYRNQEVRRRILELADKGVLVAGNYLGDPAEADDPMAGIQMFHSVIAPSVKLRMFQEMDRRGLSREDYPRNNYGLIQYANDLLLKAIRAARQPGKDSFDGTETVLFDKQDSEFFRQSWSRSGETEDPEISTPSEFVALDAFGYDMTWEMMKYGMIKERVEFETEEEIETETVDIKNLFRSKDKNDRAKAARFVDLVKTDPAFRASLIPEDLGITRGKFQAHVQELRRIAGPSPALEALETKLNGIKTYDDAWEFFGLLAGKQIIGHNFNTLDRQAVRTITFLGRSLPNILNGDGGRRQAIMDAYPENLSVGLVILNGKLYETYADLEEKNGHLPEPFTPMLDDAYRPDGETTEIFHQINQALSLEERRRIPSKDLLLLAKMIAGQRRSAQPSGADTQPAYQISFGASLTLRLLTEDRIFKDAPSLRNTIEEIFKKTPSVKVSPATAGKRSEMRQPFEQDDRAYEALNVAEIADQLAIGSSVSKPFELTGNDQQVYRFSVKYKRENQYRIRIEIRDDGVSEYSKALAKFDFVRDSSSGVSDELDPRTADFEEREKLGLYSQILQRFLVTVRKVDAGIGDSGTDELVRGRDRVISSSELSAGSVTAAERRLQEDTQEGFVHYVEGTQNLVSFRVEGEIYRVFRRLTAWERILTDHKLKQEKAAGAVETELILNPEELEREWQIFRGAFEPEAPKSIEVAAILESLDERLIILSNDADIVKATHFPQELKEIIDRQLERNIVFIDDAGGSTDSDRETGSVETDSDVGAPDPREAVWRKTLTPENEAEPKTPAEVRKAYIKLSIEWHPNGNMSRINTWADEDGLTGEPRDAFIKAAIDEFSEKWKVINEAYVGLNKLYPRRSEMRRGETISELNEISALMGIRPVMRSKTPQPSGLPSQAALVRSEVRSEKLQEFERETAFLQNSIQQFLTNLVEPLKSARERDSDPTDNPQLRVLDNLRTELKGLWNAALSSHQQSLAIDAQIRGLRESLDVLDTQVRKVEAGRRAPVWGTPVSAGVGDVQPQSIQLSSTEPSRLVDSVLARIDSLLPAFSGIEDYYQGQFRVQVGTLALALTRFFESEQGLLIALPDAAKRVSAAAIKKIDRILKRNPPWQIEQETVLGISSEASLDLITVTLPVPSRKVQEGFIKVRVYQNRKTGQIQRVQSFSQETNSWVDPQVRQSTLPVIKARGTGAVLGKGKGGDLQPVSDESLFNKPYNVQTLTEFLDLLHVISKKSYPLDSALKTFIATGTALLQTQSEMNPDQDLPSEVPWEGIVASPSSGVHLATWEPSDRLFSDSVQSRPSGGISVAELGQFLVGANWFAQFILFFRDLLQRFGITGPQRDAAGTAFQFSFPRDLAGARILILDSNVAPVVSAELISRFPNIGEIHVVGTNAKKLTAFPERLQGQLSLIEAESRLKSPKVLPAISLHRMNIFHADQEEAFPLGTFDFVYENGQFQPDTEAVFRNTGLVDRAREIVIKLLKPNGVFASAGQHSRIAFETLDGKVFKLKPQMQPFYPVRVRDKHFFLNSGMVLGEDESEPFYYVKTDETFSAGRRSEVRSGQLANEVLPPSLTAQKQSHLYRVDPKATAQKSPSQRVSDYFNQWKAERSFRMHPVEVATLVQSGLTEDQIRLAAADAGFQMPVMDKTETEFEMLQPYLIQIAQKVYQRLKSEGNNPANILFFARDGDILFDAAVMLLVSLGEYDTLKARLTYVPIGNDIKFKLNRIFSEANLMQSDHLGEMLRDFYAQYGITRDVIEQGQTLMTLDAGFYGSIPKTIEKQLGVLYAEAVARRDGRPILAAEVVSNEPHGRFAFAREIGLTFQNLRADQIRAGFPKSTPLADLASTNLTDPSPVDIRPQDLDLEASFRKILAVSLQLLPKSFGSFGLNVDADQLQAEPQLIGEDDIQNNVDAVASFTDSIVNPVAELLLQFRLAKNILSLQAGSVSAVDQEKPETGLAPNLPTRSEMRSGETAVENIPESILEYLNNSERTDAIVTLSDILKQPELEGYEVVDATFENGKPILGSGFASDVYLVRDTVGNLRVLKVAGGNLGGGDQAKETLATEVDGIKRVEGLIKSDLYEIRQLIEQIQPKKDLTGKRSVAGLLLNYFSRKEAPTIPGFLALPEIDRPGGITEQTIFDAYSKMVADLAEMGLAYNDLKPDSFSIRLADGKLILMDAGMMENSNISTFSVINLLRRFEKVFKLQLGTGQPYEDLANFLLDDAVPVSQPLVETTISKRSEVRAGAVIDQAADQLGSFVMKGTPSLRQIWSEIGDDLMRLKSNGEIKTLAEVLDMIEKKLKESINPAAAQNAVDAEVVQLMMKNIRQAFFPDKEKFEGMAFGFQILSGDDLNGLASFARDIATQLQTDTDSLTLLLNATDRNWRQKGMNIFNGRGMHAVPVPNFKNAALRLGPAQKQFSVLTDGPGFLAPQGVVVVGATHDSTASAIATPADWDRVKAVRSALQFAAAIALSFNKSHAATLNKTLSTAASKSMNLDASEIAQLPDVYQVNNQGNVFVSDHAVFQWMSLVTKFRARQATARAA